MKSPVSFRSLPRRGFALVVTLSLMILLTVIAVGLLTLSSISLRSSSGQFALNTARANARLGLILALGELQKHAGDDRRITADASIMDGAAHPNVVGVWQSWSPKLADNPTGLAPNYNTTKDARFLTWLTSNGTPEDLESKDWAKSGSMSDPVELFSEEADGFTLEGSRVEVMPGKPSAGAFAWSVVQDATRAKINIAGPEDDQLVRNEELQVQGRPSLAQSVNFNQPSTDWNARANRVLSIDQARLDTDLWKGDPAALIERGDFTAQGLGLITDVVNGGLKTDLNLGFELSDNDFDSDTWGDFKNPFRSGATQFSTPSSYRGQRPLFRPLTTSGSVRVDISFPPANTYNEFPAAAVPTFHTLRSYYRTPYHLYNTADGPTLFERGMDHVALKIARTGTGYPNPSLTPPAVTTKTSYRPVLDRVLYLLSVGIGADKEVRLVMTPIVTLWNPYNVALEIEGAVAYPWMDVPFTATWTFRKNGVAEGDRGVGMSRVMGAQLMNSHGHGRSVNPYFFASITPTGSGTASAGESIRFRPGEVRVFAPTSQTDLELKVTDSIRKRTLPLRPVDNPNQLSARGGFLIPMKTPLAGDGFTRQMTTADSVAVNFSPAGGADYPFSVGLEDATRTKIANPTDNTRGESITDVQTVNYAQSGAVASMKSPFYTFTELNNPALRQPFGLIETYHRVASDSSLTRRADLVFTTNPRQAFINSYLTTGSFVAGPHYETRMRSVSTFNGILETGDGGRTAFYGRSNSALTGESHLAFFEAPQAPLLSLAAFQHADLSGTAYSSANQFANSWASAYLSKSTVAERIIGGGGGRGEATYTRSELPIYDYSYLANEALFDSFFFSGAAPTLQPGNGGGSPSAWNNEIARVTLKEFIEDPLTQPLQNSRMRLHLGGLQPTQLKEDLAKPEGCLKIAGHLYVDGAFNINSTSEKAWVAFLSGLRDRDFDVRDGSPPSGGKTAFPRFRNPIGTDSNHWMGFRALTDTQVEELAKNIVVQIKTRGPFLSLGEFVNRRIDNSSLSLKGTIQAAIDATTFNQSALYDSFATTGYPTKARSNITPANAGVGIPGYLTQADVLQSIAPVMTARSDTFTIRSYGEAKNNTGKVTATAWCEAVVQRTPEFVDEANSAYTATNDLNPVNKQFGRRFAIVSFRYLSNKEVAL
jgi:hypothetical protein